MSSKIYGKLAITNLKNNRKSYVPYILMAVLSVMMYYIVGGMAQGNNGLSKNVKMIMGYMNGLLMIFSVIFLFYTNSFLIKRRKREIGIYNILGMGKGHIAKMLAIEAVITAFISIFGGILLGIVFGKLMYLVLGKLLHYDISVKFTVEIPVLEKTFVFFVAIFVLILLYNLLQIRIVSPVELLHGSAQGEREPKTKWLLAIVGAILLGIGYYIAQTTGNPLDAMTKFFFAVVCVVLGTYGLFIAGSIAVLKMLKKNKKYYYQAKHFTAVSGMVYRMKQNAVGLANICILSTMVLIMVSTTVCLYVGMNDIISVRYPRECEVTIYRTNAQTEEKVHTIIEEIIRKNNTKAENERIYHSGELTGYLEDNKMILDPDKYYSNQTSGSVVLIPLADYNRLEEKNETLNDGEVLLFSTQTKSYGQNEIYLDDTKLTERICLRMRVDGQEGWYPLVSWGTHWYEADGQWEVLLEDTSDIEVLVESLVEDEVQVEKISLEGLPKRTDYSLRLQVEAMFLDEQTCKLIFRDVGFGEFFAPTDFRVEKTIRLGGINGQFNSMS